MVVRTVTFRAKLLQAILGLVIATTAASLVIAQRQNAASYRAVVDDLFHDQTAAFQREHETRLEVAAGETERLAMSVRLFAALEANDPEVYKIAADELRLGEFTFFRLLNARGDVIPPPADGRAGRLDLVSVRGALVPAVTDPAGGNTGVQVGFIEVTRGQNRPSIAYRILSSPIVNFDTQVGTLIIGQRIRQLATEGEDSAPQNLHSALWLDGRLVDGNIPANVQAPLIDVLESASDEFRADGENYRYQRFRLNEGSSYPPAHLVSIFSLAEFEEQQQLLVLRIVLIGAVALVIAGLLGMALSRQLARPIAGLVAATRQIRKGNYALTLAPSSTREMNTLADAFNDMAAGLALKDRYHSLLQQVTDPQVAEELVAGSIKLGGELRDVTVMFCDIRGYTSFTVGRRPEDVIEILNHHMGAMTRIVQAHRGVINQFAGDAIMALFGAPKSYGDDAERAVQCACAMMAERERLNAAAPLPVRVGIGIASGQMVAGCIGAESRSDYTVVGERVNLAARLGSFAAAGQIVVDQETRRRIAPTWASEPLQPLQLKGFSEPVIAYGIALARVAAV